MTGPRTILLLSAAGGATLAGTDIIFNGPAPGVPLQLDDGDRSSMTVTFSGVPQFPATGSNTFSVTMLATGDVVITYGGVTATNGLVGVTEGGGAADPGPTDLSAGGPYSRSGTTYEQFTFGDFDLEDSVLNFDQ